MSTLAPLLAEIPASNIPSRSVTAVSAVALLAATDIRSAPSPPAIPAAEPPPCRLSTQQLVDLLKMPTCIGETRRVVLDQLGNRYRRRFSDAWEFVRYAEEHKLDLSTSPARRNARDGLETPSRKRERGPVVRRGCSRFRLGWSEGLANQTREVVALTR